MQSLSIVSARQMTFVVQHITRAGFQIMPFSPERTKEIQLRIDARLQSGQANDWEVSFLTNMAARFQKYGTNTRLSKAQYASLHKVLKLEREPSSRTSAQTNERAPRQIMVPLVIVVAFVALIGSFFDSTSSQSTSNGSPATSAPQSASSAYVYVTGTRVNQRDGPSTSDRVMGVLVEGTRVQLLHDQGQWAQIRSDLGTGWMSSSFLSRDGPVVAQPTTQDRGLRASDVRIIDGDTVNIRGITPNVRLVGFNAPETWRPSCPAERRVGERATARLSQLVRNAASIEFERVACSCRPGTEGTGRCNFGRLCGSLFVDGQDVGRTLIGEGLAVPYRCGRTSCPPRPQAWCR